MGGAKISARSLDREGRAHRRDRGRLHRIARALFRPSRQQFADPAISGRETLRALSRPRGLIPLVLHLADHDPNGIDMTRDNEERLKLYARADIEVRRIALN